MEEVINTECLRGMAPHWSLAGDKKLLSLLQDIHKNIMTRCQEANTTLEEMAISLDDAHIDLQNVNNKFMALSNSQFVESRVYDDDLDVTLGDTSMKKENAVTDSQNVEPDISKLKQSLKVLESMHECVRIIDSDSDSDSEESDGRMVYRPKDLYASRPLPHIIGSQAWKSKWHAGIIAEDSDSDSGSSKPNDEVLEQYSESESEATDTRTDKLNQLQETISSNSSIADSEPSVPTAPLTQASVATELARKLGGKLPEIAVSTPEPEPEYAKPQVAPAHVYKPQKPPTSTIFFDEPPPLEQSYQSDGDDSDEEDDIFAELRKSKPSATPSTGQTRLNADLFGGIDKSTVTSDDLFGAEKVDPSDIKQNANAPKEIDKKPVGGISVFGSSKGTESISAAILKRAQRKDSSDESIEEREVVKTSQPASSKDTNGNSNVSENTSRVNIQENVINKDKPQNEQKTVVFKENDVLQNIFDKNKQTKSKTKPNKTSEPNVTEKSDIFSDIFDDIDDIFTDPVVKVPIKDVSKNTKSIFDDDDDDLFADIAVASQKQPTSKVVESKTRGLFDSDDDDDLFSEKPHSSTQNNENTSRNIVTEVKVEKNQTKSIFNDDTNDDIFSNTTVEKIINANDKNKSEKCDDLFDNSGLSKDVKVNIGDDDNNNLFSERNSTKNNTDSLSFTSREEVNLIQNKSMAQVDNVNNNEHDNSSHEDLNESIIVNSQPCENLDKTNYNSIDSESIENALHFEEHIIDDDWNDSNFGETESENVEESGKNDFKSYEDQSNTTKNTIPIDSPERLNVAIDETSSLSNKGIKGPDNTIVVDKMIENTNDFNTVIFEKENAPEKSISSEVPGQNSDVFSDIFNDLPPAFEKPKEPKKSKNVNALFDDDSDDEALFFKKNDTVSDEKPELDSSAKADSLFRIFSDEPPAIDVDFTQKTIQSAKEESTDIKSLSLISDESNQISVTDELNDKDNKTFVSQPESKATESKTNVSNSESKNSVSKLKSQININVSTLLPGASPKKSSVVEQVDGQVASTEKISKSDVESQVKSVSFDGDADPGLLDNKISKERAKIQVKRRPSTRRARREAVKKSAIDLDTSDATDDIDGVDVKNREIIKDTVQDVKETINDSIKNTQVQNVKSKLVYVLNDEDIFSNTGTQQINNIEKIVSTKGNAEKLKEETQSVAYDADDIFKTIKVTKVENLRTPAFRTENKHRPYKSSEKHEDLFQNETNKESQNITIKATGSLEKSIQRKASIFDDLSDEENELFQGKKPTSSKADNIFGSDSDEELFGSGVKKCAEKNTESKSSNFKVEVKKSLFDDDSDNDLFGSKPSTSGTKPQFSKVNEAKPTNTQSVDEDPLSLLTNYVNDDI